MPAYIRRKRIRLDGRYVHYLVAGHGSPLLVIHGGGAGSDKWRHNIPELAKHHKVFVPDLPGIGDSQPLRDEFDYSDFVTFVDRFSQFLGLQQFHLLGHSLGGCIALQYALQRPKRVSSLVLVSSMGLGKGFALWARIFCSPIFYAVVGEPMFALLGALRKGLRALTIPIRFLDLFTRTTLSMSKKIITRQGQVVVLRDRLGELMMPTMVVWGARDNIVPVTHAYDAGKLIPNCRVHVLGDCGHNVHRQHVGEFSKLLKDFLGHKKPVPVPVLARADG
ncbi:MAG: alpha/beta fold hydrolase [Chloroflexi bacterium]|nr:alpha/beta fold hydrolase [Chloroflexota bacterium]